MVVCQNPRVIHLYLYYLHIENTHCKNCEGEMRMCTRSYDIKRELVSSRETLRYMFKIVYLTTHGNYFLYLWGDLCLLYLGHIVSTVVY